jgi:predicted DsbA family dithiol-disulfide isomerase
LLHWAQIEGRQKALKMALFDAYFTQGQNPSSHELLLAVAGQAGLDSVKAAEVLASDAYADEVRAQQQFYQQNGINSVPAVIINERHLISGGQPPEVFEQALRQILAGT